MYLSKIRFFLIILVINFAFAITTIEGVGSREDSPNGSHRSQSPDFDWESMIDWPASPVRNENTAESQVSIQSRSSNINTKTNDMPKIKKKRKEMSLKERYTAERLKEMNHSYYLSILKDPQGRENKRANQIKNYHKREAEKKERLNNLTGTEKIEEESKQRSIKDRRNLLARLRRQSRSQSKPKGEFKMSEKDRINNRKRSRKCRLLKKLKAQKDNSQC